jgi:hypothetical protein
MLSVGVVAGGVSHVSGSFLEIQQTLISTTVDFCAANVNR